MDHAKSRITPQDTLVLFADLQEGIVELTKTLSLDRLKKGVLNLAKLARLFEMPVIISGVRGDDGNPAKVISQIAEGAGDHPTHHRTTCDSFLNAEIVTTVT